MSEAEFNLLLEEVRTAMTMEPEEEFVPRAWMSFGVPSAANDNGPNWPLVPFPDGWFAAC
ncbi:MAG: hypothetical protein HY852_00750 [Bradyrhizobium sp.]|uniref:hypothetical protein n=1 Tax=Bradyrhizobium sp. TaxID=376 RepID=UPI0025C29322|nr:hypothetical protein [Bradyrhizobium sp.]MBI5260330.1 hypothetical protein [Bradyrhizobium sp.]